MKTINYENSRKKIVEKFSKRFCDSGAIFHVEEFFDMLFEKADWPQGKKSEDFRGIKGRK